MAAEIMPQLRQLEIAVRGRVEGLLHGDHRGLLPGAGATAGDARPYVAGDDVRRFDWNVTARGQRPYVRDTEADHELETTLVVDTSGSMAFGTGRGEKRDAALAVAAVFGFATAVGGNRIGGVILGEKTVRIPPRSGRSHVYRTLGAVARAGHAGGIDLAAGLSLAAKTRPRRGLVVVISDFVDDGPWERPLRVLAARHDVIAAIIGDPRELDLPDIGVVRMQDAESGRLTWVDTASSRFRARFAQAARARRDEIRRRVVRAGAQPLVLSTETDWVDDVVRWVLQRRRAGVASGRSA